MWRKFPRRGKQVASFGAFEFGFLEGERFAVVLKQAGFGIEEVHMRWTAGHIEKNDAPGAGLMMRRSNCIGPRGAIHVIGSKRRKFRGQQIGQRQKAKAGAGTGQPLAA